MEVVNEGRVTIIQKEKFGQKIVFFAEIDFTPFSNQAFICIHTVYSHWYRIHIDIVSLTCPRLHVLFQCKIEWRSILFVVIYLIDCCHLHILSVVSLSYPAFHSQSLSHFLFFLNLYIEFPKFDIKQNDIYWFLCAQFVHVCVCLCLKSRKCFQIHALKRTSHEFEISKNSKLLHKIRRLCI